MSLVVLKKEKDNILTDIIAKPLFIIFEGHGKQKRYLKTGGKPL